jgi:hypothetical protein
MGFFSSIFYLLGAQSPVHIRLLTLLSGAKKIGSDSLGNVYYEHKARSGYNHPRRWVLYKGAPSQAPFLLSGMVGYITRQTAFLRTSPLLSANLGNYPLRKI